MTDDFLEVARSEVTGAASVCSVALALDQLGDKAAGARTALGDRTIPGSAIARAFRKFGIPINPGTINRHRKGDCACERAAA